MYICVCRSFRHLSCSLCQWSPRPPWLSSSTCPSTPKSSPRSHHTHTDTVSGSCPIQSHSDCHFTGSQSLGKSEAAIPELGISACTSTSACIGLQQLMPPPWLGFRLCEGGLLVLLDTGLSAFMHMDCST